MLPILNYVRDDYQVVKITFMAKIISGEIKYDKEEILDVKWISIEDIERMTEKELRAIRCNRDVISDAKANNVYPLSIIKNLMD